MTVAVPLALFFGGMAVYSEHQADKRARQEEAWQQKQALRQEKRKAGEQLAESECSNQYDAKRDKKSGRITSETSPYYFCKVAYDTAHNSCIADEGITVDDHLSCMSHNISSTIWKNEDETDAQPSNDSAPWQEYQVRNGENLTDVFKNVGLTTIALYKVLDADSKNNLARLNPGVTIKFLIDQGNILQQLKVRLNNNQTLVLTRIGDRFQERIVTD